MFRPGPLHKKSLDPNRVLPTVTAVRNATQVPAPAKTVATTPSAAQPLVAPTTKPQVSPATSLIASAVTNAAPPVAAPPPMSPLPSPAAPASAAIANWDQHLLSLMEQEQLLLQDFGPEHPQVREVRARLKAVTDFLANKAAQAPAQGAQPPKLPAATQSPPPAQIMTNPAPVAPTFIYTTPVNTTPVYTTPVVKSPVVKAPVKPKAPAAPISLAHRPPPRKAASILDALLEERKAALPDRKREDRAGQEQLAEFEELARLAEVLEKQASTAASVQTASAGSDVEEESEPRPSTSVARDTQGVGQRANAEPASATQASTQAALTSILESLERSWQVPSFVSQVVAGVMLLLAVHVVSVGWLARRMRREVAKVRHLGALATAPALAAPAAVVTTPEGPAKAATEPDLPPPQFFELGPSYEEELQKSREAEQQRGEAVFQELFRQNVELQNQMTALENESDQAV